MNNIPVVLLDDIYNHMGDFFSRDELYDLTSDFINSKGKNTPKGKITMLTSKEDYYSKYRIVKINLSVLSDREKIEFFKQLSMHSRVDQNTVLRDQISKLIDTFDAPNRSRENISNLLANYSDEVQTQWKNSLNFYNHKDYRNALDSIRLTIELLVKILTNSSASLENQKGNLGKFLEENGISKESRNLFLKMLKNYEDIQNNNAKHGTPDGINAEEISFLMNQSYVIIKFLIDCDKKRERNNAR